MPGKHRLQGNPTKIGTRVYNQIVKVENSHGKDSISYTVRAVQAPVAPTIRYMMTTMIMMMMTTMITTMMMTTMIMLMMMIVMVVVVVVNVMMMMMMISVCCRVSKISTDTIALVWSRPHNGGALIQGAQCHHHHYYHTRS